MAAAPTAAPPSLASARTEHGLLLSVEPLAGAGAPEECWTRMLALRVPAGTPFASSFAPGPFRAAFRGELDVEVRDRFTFTFEGHGEIALRIADKVALHGHARPGAPLSSAPLRLSKGKNRIEAVYTSPALGDAQVRVLWSTAEWKPEPIAPAALSPGAPDVLVPALRAARARAEVQRMQCTACHHLPGGERGPGAPDLRDVGARLQPGYVFAWLLHPVRHGDASRQMPHFFADDAGGRQQAADVAAYLAACVGQNDAAPAPVPEGDAALGGRLFAQLGCVGCHPRPGVAPKDTRIALAHVPSKWRQGQLAPYLQAPQHSDPLAAMPDFALSVEEAAALAAFLGSRDADALPVPSGDAGRGAQLVRALACSSCHVVPDAVVHQGTAPPWPTVAPRVAATADLCGGPPRYERVADVAFDELARVQGPPPLAEAAEAAVVTLRCAACHARDGAVDAWSAHAAEVADLLPAAPVDPAHPEPAQTRPQLTWAGEKLSSKSLHALLMGTTRSRARPWLHARMPAFPAHARVLTLGLACGHGVGDDHAQAPPDAALAALGANLVSAEKGFACVTCHGIGDKPPTQVFEVQGVNFALSAARLRPDYFKRWMRNPQRIDPSSKMPRYADAQGKTAFAQILGGDADRQFDAMWAWLQTLE
jgi:cytochrome c2